MAGLKKKRPAARKGEGERKEGPVPVPFMQGAYREGRGEKALSSKKQFFGAHKPKGGEALPRKVVKGKGVL